MITKLFSPFLFTIFYFLFSVSAFADINVTTELGFDGYYKPGKWTPIVVTIQNSDNDLSGILSAEIKDNAGRKEYECSMPVNSPKNSKKRFILYITLGRYNASDFNVRLSVSNKNFNFLPKKVSLIDSKDDKLVIVLGEDIAGLNILSGDFGGGKIYVNTLKPDMAPDKWKGYDGVDLLVISDESARTLTPQQQSALELWVYSGGTLFVSTGDLGQSFRNTYIDKLLPVNLGKMTTVTSLSSLENFYGKEFQNPADREIVICNSSPKDGSKIRFSQNNIPIIVEKSAGLGRVIFSAFNIKDFPFNSWDGKSALFKEYLNVSLNEYYYYNNIDNRINEVLADIPEMKAPSFVFIALFLLAYILTIGPLNYFFLKSRKKLEYAWGTVPIIVIIFSVGAYTIGHSSKGGKIITNNLSIAYIQPESDIISFDTYWGIFSPGKAEYDIYMEDTESFITGFEKDQYSQRPSNISIWQGDKMGLKDFKINMWAMRTFLSQSCMKMGNASISANLKLTDNNIIGEINNKLSFDLKNCIIISDNYAMSLGDIKKGEKKKFNFDYTTASNIKHIIPIQSVGLAYPQQNVLEDFLNEFLANQQKFVKAERRGYLTLVGITDNSFTKIKIGKDFKQNSCTIVVVRFPLIVDKNINNISAENIERKILDYKADNLYIDRGELELRDGHLIAQFKIPQGNDNKIPSELRLKLGYSSSYNLDVYCYNWTDRRWDILQTKSNIYLSPANKYFYLPDGIVKVKLDSKTDTQRITQLDLEVRY